MIAQAILLLTLLEGLGTVATRTTTASLLRVKDRLVVEGTSTNLPLTQIGLKPFPFISGVS